MVTMDEFIKEDLNEYSYKMIMESINKGRKTIKEKDEFVFNRYSLEIDYSLEKVIIYDDIFSEDEPIELGLSDFIDKIQRTFN